MKQYVILVQPEYGLPHVVSSNNSDYLDFLAAGYQVIYSGNKKDCEEQAEEMIAEMYEYN